MGADFLVRIDKVQSQIQLCDKGGELNTNKSGVSFFSPDRYFNRSSLMGGEGGLLMESVDPYFYENKDYSNILMDILKLKRDVPVIFLEINFTKIIITIPL